MCSLVSKVFPSIFLFNPLQTTRRSGTNQVCRPWWLPWQRPAASQSQTAPRPSSSPLATTSPSSGGGPMTCLKVRSTEGLAHSWPMMSYFTEVNSGENPLIRTPWLNEQDTTLIRTPHQSKHHTNQDTSPIRTPH